MVTGLFLVAPKIIEILKKKESFQDENEKIKKDLPLGIILFILFWILFNFFVTWYAVFLSARCKSSGFLEVILAFFFPYIYLPFRYIKPCK